MVITLIGLAIVISGVIQAIAYGLSAYHPLLLLDLSYIIIISTLSPFFTFKLGKDFAADLDDIMWIAKERPSPRPSYQKQASLRAV